MKHEIKAGQPLTVDGHEWKIRGRISDTKIIIERAEAPARIVSIDEVAAALGGGKTEKAERPVVRDLEDISEAEWEVAQQRQTIVLGLRSVPHRTRADVEGAARMAGVNPSTVYDWLAAYERGGTLSSLIPRKRGPRTGSKRIRPEIESIIAAKVEAVFLNKKPVSVAKLDEAIREACAEAGLKPPAPGTIRYRVSSPDPEQVLIKQGRRDRARNKYRPVRGEFPDEGTPLAVIQIDHTQGDIVLVDEENRLPVDRPWITIAIDVNTRIVVGIYISFEAPSAAAVGMCMVNAILPKRAYLAELGVPGEWPVSGKPGRILVDNAKEFRGETLKWACGEHAIGLDLRPVKTPHYGGHIERMMKTSGDEIHCLPGTTFSNTRDREGFDPEATAAMTIREFEAYLVDWVVNKYNCTIHRQTDVTPIYMYRKAIMGTKGSPGIGTRREPNENKLRLDFMPHVKRSVDRHGVLLDYVFYWDEVLRSKIDDADKHVFRFDPRDMSVLHFWDPETEAYYDIPYRNTARPAVSRHEIRKAKAERKREGLEHFDEEALFATIKRLRERAEASVAKTKDARKTVIRARQAEAVAAKRKSAGAGTPATLPPAEHGRTDPTRAPVWQGPDGDPFAQPVTAFEVSGALMPADQGDHGQ